MRPTWNMNEYERYELWRTMNGFRIFFGEWNMFVFTVFVLSWAFITYKLPFFFGYKEIPIKIQLTTNQTWLAGNIIEQQKGDSPAVPYLVSKAVFMLVSHAGIGLHIHIIHDFLNGPAMTCSSSPKSGIDGSWWNQQIPETSRDCDFLDDRRHMSFFLSFFGIVRSYHATRHTLYHAISQWYLNDIPMISPCFLPAGSQPEGA